MSKGDSEDDSWDVSVKAFQEAFARIQKKGRPGGPGGCAELLLGILAIVFFIPRNVIMVFIRTYFGAQFLSVWSYIVTLFLAVVIFSVIHGLKKPDIPSPVYSPHANQVRSTNQEKPQPVKVLSDKYPVGEWIEFDGRWINLQAEPKLAFLKKTDGIVVYERPQIFEWVTPKAPEEKSNPTVARRAALETADTSALTLHRQEYRVWSNLFGLYFFMGLAQVVFFMGLAQVVFAQVNKHRGLVHSNSGGISLLFYLPEIGPWMGAYYEKTGRNLNHLLLEPALLVLLALIMGSIGYPAIKWFILLGTGGLFFQEIHILHNEQKEFTQAVDSFHDQKRQSSTRKQADKAVKRGAEKTFDGAAPFVSTPLHYPGYEAYSNFFPSAAEVRGHPSA
ncbi:hypothetical protein [Cerasicoccus arenae]|uniref:Uncharacterized protein n=1 Tax=Cerasicoccus arenae TaxID=424488 RepID=A0A8J3GE66_9BACT|nr:hypothetical protein [Cerasicoccus arenae]MBK1857768.1 hypothetical protein [Cerasicoccus arenae]GHC11945.1 hypothetical protein GCM10007047_31640 [Cerasicoccus arenae]